jgi:2-keto-4-pentenoate hydratase/2-oxohepta-3-ene-1,7-dioic acid hydratase in catechol pathway
MTVHYGLCTYSIGHGPKRAGILIGEKIWSISELAGVMPNCGLLDSRAPVLALIERWAEVLPALDRLAEFASNGVNGVAATGLHDCRVHPPIDLPRQVFCTGANYRKHVIDITVDTGTGPEGLDREGLYRWAANMMDERARTGEPYVFTKPVAAISGAFDPIELPSNTKKPDWELELAVVIGKPGHRIHRDDAFAHIAGYTIANDISARDLIARQDYKMLGTDWLKSKGQKGFLPLGPSLVPAHLVSNPENLKMVLSVNDQIMQNESSADMIFGIARQIEYISSYTPLLPGDVICTGSPAGNGTHYNRFLREGDVVVGRIEGLGEQRAMCVLAT